jgi:hypothetical protein
MSRSHRTVLGLLAFWARVEVFHATDRDAVVAPVPHPPYSIFFQPDFCFSSRYTRTMGSMEWRNQGSIRVSSWMRSTVSRGGRC